jgi:hypothetical protein
VRDPSRLPPPEPTGIPPHYDRQRRKGGEALIAYQSFASSSRRNVVVESFAVHSKDPHKQVVVGNACAVVTRRK